MFLSVTKSVIPTVWSNNSLTAKCPIRKLLMGNENPPNEAFCVRRMTTKIKLGYGKKFSGPPDNKIFDFKYSFNGILFRWSNSISTASFSWFWSLFQKLDFTGLSLVISHSTTMIDTFQLRFVNEIIFMINN